MSSCCLLTLQTIQTALQLQLSAFAPQDRYNCDETGLFYKQRPNGSLTTAMSTHGQRLDKTRISIHFCCNATGSHKLQPWIIGHSKEPRAFRASGVNIHALDFTYRSNKTAWMTTSIFCEWIKWFDCQMAGRKVVLLMDNLSAHTAGVRLAELEGTLQNTTVLALPPNSTSKTQPLDQGIIRTFKAYYRRRWLRFMLEEYELQRNAYKTMNVLMAMRWTTAAWKDVKESTIEHCWQHCKLYSNTTDCLMLNEQQTIESELESELNASLKSLQQADLINRTMRIEHLLNPIEEEVTNIDGDITEDIITQYQAQEDADNDDEVEELVHYTPFQALHHLQALILSEEQSKEPQNDLIYILNKHEEVIRARMYADRRQITLSKAWKQH